MNEVKSRILGERQWGNQGTLGFVPTDRSIVEMEMSLIDLSEIIGNDYPVNICDLSGGTGNQLNVMNNYLCNEGINNVNAYYNELSQERYAECEKRYPCMHKLNCDFFNVKVGAKVNKALDKKVFSIIRNNPPYMFIEKRGMNVRAEVEFFIKNSMMDIEGGIHIMEVPLHQLTGIKNFLSMLTYRYEIFIAKFPAEVFKNYKQVAVIMKKKKEFSQDKERVTEILEIIQKDKLPYLNDLKDSSTKVFKVSKEDFKKGKSIDIFRENKISSETLRNGLDAVIDDLITSERKSTYRTNTKKELKPVISLTTGHLAQLLSAGSFNGIMGNLLVKGGVKKIIETSITKENEKSITTQTEVLKPYFELTNKCGEIIAKEF